MDVPYIDPFAFNLKRRREELGLSQRDLAEMLDPTFLTKDPRLKIKSPLKRSVAAISRYERGERMPKVDRIRQLCLALDISADDLLGLESRK